MTLLLLQTLGPSTWLQQSRPPRKFHFPLGAAGSLVSAPLANARSAKHGLTESSVMPSSPMSEDETIRCEGGAPAMPVLSRNPPGTPCAMGWGSSAVATCAGPLQIVQNLAMANAFFAQVNAQGGARTPGQAHALEPAFLQSCCLQLEQVCVFVCCVLTVQTHEVFGTCHRQLWLVRFWYHDPGCEHPGHNHALDDTFQAPSGTSSASGALLHCAGLESA